MKMPERSQDKVYHTVLKVIMTAAFLWSGFFWSGVTVIWCFIDVTGTHMNLAYEFLTGSAVLLIALVLCWLRLYLIQIIPAIAGIILFLNPAREMIDHAASTGVVFKPTFEQRFMPAAGFAAISLIFFIIKIVEIMGERMAKKEEYNNRPAESILDKHK